MKKMRIKMVVIMKMNNISTNRPRIKGMKTASSMLIKQAYHKPEAKHLSNPNLRFLIVKVEEDNVEVCRETTHK